MTTAIVNDWPIVALLMDRGARLAEVSKRGFKLTYLCEQAHPVPGSATDAALIRVRRALSERGMLNDILTPAQIRELTTQGRWTSP